MATVLDWKIQQLKNLKTSSELNFLQRGELYHEVKKLTAWTDKEMKKEFGRDEKTISREIRLYLKAKQNNVDYEKLSENHTDREIMRALDGCKDNLEDYFIAFKLFTKIPFTQLTSIINGTLKIEDYKKNVENDYKQKLAQIDKLQEMFKKKMTQEQKIEYLQNLYKGYDKLQKAKV